MNYSQRIQALVQAMQADKVSNLILSNPTTIFYLTGYENFEPGERLYALVLDASGQANLYLNRLFPQPHEIDSNIAIHWYKDGEPVVQAIAQVLNSTGKIGVDKDWRAHFLLTLMAQVPQATMINGSPLSDNLRQVKSAQEQELLIKASALNDQAMDQLIGLVKQGLSEQDMTAELKLIYQQLGKKGLAFDPIIAYGPNGADPHHTTSTDRPQVGQSVVIDIGSYYQGYASDMTRTVFYGQPDDESIKVYNLVKEANLAAIAQVRPGVTYASIDKAARDVIEAGGYGPYFTHRTGHNIGIECHEPGDVGEFNQDLVQVGHVFSIEPGIYLPGKLGVRIEDLVIVTPDGCKVLNQVSKDLTIIDPA